MPENTRMMTYAEAASALRIKPDSVARRARNRRWHKELGNDGLVRIAVPLSIIPPDSPPEVPSDISPDIPDDIRPDTQALARIAALETEVRILREVQDDLRADRDAWRTVAERRWWHNIIPRK